MGDLLILSWFLSNKNIGPSRVQAIGIVTASAVLGTLWIAGTAYIPTWAFATVVPVALFGLIFAYANYKDRVPKPIWSRWENGLNTAGLIIVPLAAAATFGISPWTMLPAMAAVAVLAWTLNRTGLIPQWLKDQWHDIGAWTATFNFMIWPVAQLWNIHTDPQHLYQISLLSIAFGTLGNLLMLGEASESKNRIWTVGSAWAVIVGGIGVLSALYAKGALDHLHFLGLGAAPIYWIAVSFILATLGFYTRQNMKLHSESFRRSLSYLLPQKKEPKTPQAPAPSEKEVK